MKPIEESLRELESIIREAKRLFGKGTVGEQQITHPLESFRAALSQAPAVTPSEPKWTERERAALDDLMKRLDLTEHAVLRQGLRVYQLIVFRNYKLVDMTEWKCTPIAQPTPDLPVSSPSQPLAEAQIEYLVNRFLSWRLPEDFNPDGGISFKRTFNEDTPFPMKHEPTGTNLFDYTQAKEMIHYLLEGLPASSQSSEPK